MTTKPQPDAPGGGDLPAAMHKADFIRTLRRAHEQAPGSEDAVKLERDLCAAMLESQLATHQQTESMNGNDYYPGLRIFPLEGVDEVNAMCALEEPDSVVWRNCKWRPRLVELRFRALFDFETFRGLFREFRYVDCIVLQSRDDDIGVGQRLLVDAVDVRFFDASNSVAT